MPSNGANYTVLAPGEAPPAALLANPPTSPRSCVTCRRRKVRCDKLMPCSNCSRNKTLCVFPAPGRAPRRPRVRDPDAPIRNPSQREAELLERLHKLEAVVEELSNQLEDRERTSLSPDGNAGSGHNSSSSPRGTPASTSAFSGREASVTVRRRRLEDLPTDSTDTLNNTFGRLVLSDKAKGQYVANAFWSKLTEKLDEIRSSTEDLADESDYSEDEVASASFNDSTSTGSLEHRHQGFFFGFSSVHLNTEDLHPHKSHIPLLWRIYLSNVEPVVKLVHVPTWEVVIRQAATGDTKPLSFPKQAMLFAIYFSAITSISDEEVQERFRAPRGDLLAQYRFAFEQLLAKANFLTVPDLTIINALAIFITVVRTTDNSRFCWTMTAVAVRLAEALGLQRDGTAFNLSIYDVEIRRRIWWIICSFDLRASEESGTDSAALVFNCDTRMPTNCNDADFGPETTELKPRSGPTDMSLAMVRHEITFLCRKMITMANNSPVPGEPNAIEAIREREITLQQINQDIHRRYFSCPEAQTHPLVVLAEKIFRVVIAKMSLVVYQPLLLHVKEMNKEQDGTEKKPTKGSEFEKVLDRLFASAAEIVDCNHRLHTEEKFIRWRWLFATYTQWHAVTFVLMECGYQPWTASLERAYQIVDTALRDDRIIEFSRKPNHNTVWLPVKTLLSKAQKHRAAEIERLRNDPEAMRALDKEDFRMAQARRSWLFKCTDQDISDTRQRWLDLIGVTLPHVQDGPCDSGSLPPQTMDSDILTPAFDLMHSETSEVHQVHGSENENMQLNEMMHQPVDSMMLWNIIDQDAKRVILDGARPGNSQPEQMGGPAGLINGAMMNGHLPQQMGGGQMPGGQMPTQGMPPQQMSVPMMPGGPPHHQVPHPQQSLNRLSMSPHSMTMPSSGPWDWPQSWYNGQASRGNTPQMPPAAATSHLNMGMTGMQQGMVGSLMMGAPDMELDNNEGTINWGDFQETLRSMPGQGVFQGPTSGI